MSVFSPEALKKAVMDGGLSTKPEAVPDGDYVAITEKYDIRATKAKDDPNKTYTWLDLNWSIDDAEVKEQLGRDKVIVRQSFQLELTPSGGLDRGKGKNYRLGKLLELFGLNSRPSWTFDDLVGNVARIQVTSRVDDDGDPAFNDVKKVSPVDAD